MDKIRPGEDPLDWYRRYRATLPAERKLPREEVLALLRCIATGQTQVRLKDSRFPFHSGYCNHIWFLAEQYTIVVFNDCGAWDYIEAVEAEDGRDAEFDDWGLANPESLLEHESPRLYQQLVKAFLAAR